jgi:hypothetical protein
LLSTGVVELTTASRAQSVLRLDGLQAAVLLIA